MPDPTHIAPAPHPTTGTADQHARYVTARALYASGVVQAAHNSAITSSAANTVVGAYAIGYLIRTLATIDPDRADQATRHIMTNLAFPHALMGEIDGWAREYGMDSHTVAAAGAATTQQGTRP